MPKSQPSLSPRRFSTFGELLRFLRERAHLSQRELALLVGYHFSYISYLEKNTRAVDEASLLGRFVPALGIEDQPEWVTRLLELSKHKNDGVATVKVQVESTVSGDNVNFLPTSLTSMIGREYESARLQKTILDPEIRLVTVVGPPGVGKTCLALHTARKVSAVFKHGVVFVDLTPIRSPQMFLPALALTLGVPESSGASFEETVKSALANKSLLIVLDNFEQIADAAPQLLPLFGASAGVKMLVTSREVLRLRGEHELHLSPLPVPVEYKNNSIENLQQLPSVALFVERAQAVKPEFKLDEKNASHLAEICHRLDGLPLAIELAAARIGTLSLSSMLEQFDRRFEWLTQGARELPEWRRTLQGALEWSYNLLSEKERTLLCRLSTFTGGWTLAAAEEVCSDDEVCTRAEIFNLLIQLVNKSLVAAEVEADRFHFLETLREFAHEKLKASGDLERMRERHFTYYMTFSQTAKPHLSQGKDQILWLDRMETEHNNLREALAWVVETPSRAEAAMNFGLAVHVFWLTRSYIREARHWLAKILALDPAPSPTRANLLRFASDYASTQGDFANAQLLEAEAMNISRALGDEDGIYYSMDGMAMVAGMQGDYKYAAELLEEVLQYRRRIGDTLRLTGTLNNLAIATRRLGDLERSMQLFTEAIETTKAMGNQKSLAHALSGLAEVHVQRGEIETALRLHRDAIAVRHQLGDQKGLAASLNSIAMCAEKLGNHHLAAQLESVASKIRHELGVSINPAARDEHDTLLKRMRATLGDEAFEEDWANGQAMAQEKVIALAMG